MMRPTNANHVIPMWVLCLSFLASCSGQLSQVFGSSQFSQDPPAAAGTDDTLPVDDGGDSDIGGDNSSGASQNSPSVVDILAQGAFKVAGSDVIYRSDGVSTYCTFRDADHFVYATGKKDSNGNPDLSSATVLAAPPSKMTNAGTCPWGDAATAGSFVPYTNPNSEVVLFEDNFLSGTTASSHLIYRTEGSGNEIVRQSATTNGTLAFQKASATYSSLVHPAQYQNGIVKVQYQLADPNTYAGVKIMHNGFAQSNGTPYSRPGISVRFYTDVAVISSDDDRWIGGQIIAVAPIASPVGVANEVAISFDIITGSLGIRKITPGDPRGEFRIQLPPAALQKTSPAGFAVFSNGGSYSISRLRVSAEDQRKLLLLDDLSNQLYDMENIPVGQIPAAQLPGENLESITIGVDIAHFRSLIMYGPQADPSADDPGFINWSNQDSLTAFTKASGYAVRDLLTGAMIAVFDKKTFLCNPGLNNGSSFDGYQLINEARMPANVGNQLQYASARLCWVNWRALDTALANQAAGQPADFSQFVTPHVFSDGQAQKISPAGAGKRLGFADALNALDGSLARFLLDDELGDGTIRTEYTYHPNIRPFFDVDELALPVAPSGQADAGAGGTVMIVRDRDGGFIERWGKGGVQVQTVRMDLFDLPGMIPQIFEISPLQATNAGAFVASANDMQSLQTPGKIYVQEYRFHPGSGAADPLGQSWDTLDLSAGTGAIHLRSPDGRPLIQSPYEVLVPWNFQSHSAFLPPGDVRIPDGTIYYSNGTGHVCAYATWNDYMIAGGTADMAGVIDIASLPAGTLQDGNCVTNLPPGDVRLADGTIFYSNGTGHVCAYATWADYLIAGGTADMSGVTDIEALPTGTVQDADCSTPLAAGRFATPDGTIYWSNGGGHYCAYASWAAYVAGGGHRNLSNVTQIDDIPPGNAYDGTCQ